MEENINNLKSDTDEYHNMYDNALELEEANSSDILFEDSIDDETMSSDSELSLDTIECSNQVVKDAFKSVCCVHYYIYQQNFCVLIASGSTDDILRVYKLLYPYEQLVSLHEFNHFENSVIAVEFSPDGKYLAAGSFDKSIKIYEIHFNVENNNYPNISYLYSIDKHTSDVEWLHWYSKGSIILTGLKDGSLWMWNIVKKNPMHIFLGHSTSVSSGNFIYNDKMIVSGDTSGNLFFWDVHTGNSITNYSNLQNITKKSTYNPSTDTQYQSVITIITIHQRFSLVAVGLENGSVLLFNAKAKKKLAIFEDHSDSIEALCFNDIGDVKQVQLASGSLDGKISIWNCCSYQLITQFSPKWMADSTDQKSNNSVPPCITKIQWCSDSMGFPSLWDVYSEKLLKEFTGHTKCILDFSHWILDNKLYIISSSNDKTLRLWIAPLNELS